MRGGLRKTRWIPRRAIILCQEACQRQREGEGTRSQEEGEGKKRERGKKVRSLPSGVRTKSVRDHRRDVVAIRITETPRLGISCMCYSPLSLLFPHDR